MVKMVKFSYVYLYQKKKHTSFKIILSAVIKYMTLSKSYKLSNSCFFCRTGLIIVANSHSNS